MMDDAALGLIARLQAAIAGLLWMSEIDAPLEVIHWPASVLELTQERLLELTHHPPTALVQQVTVEEFFAGATADQDWFGEEERAIAQRYREVVALLKQSLTHLQGYRVGEVRLDLYIVGQTASGNWVGLATQAVET
jgi:hypothetical protein